MSSGGRAGFRNDVKPYPMQRSRVEIGDRVEVDVNQVTQAAVYSPPFCDTKGSDNDCSELDSDHVRLNTELLSMILLIYIFESCLSYLVGSILFQFGASFS